MRILTTTLCYPRPDEPEQGLFVQRRALAIGRSASQSPRGTGFQPVGLQDSGLPSPWTPGDHGAQSRTEVSVVSPLPWCPVLRRMRRIEDEHDPLPAVYPRMLSIPVLNWATDGLSYARALERTIIGLGGPRIDLIDAHFVYPDGVGAWLAGRRLGIPVVVTVRGKIVSLSRRAIRRAQIRSMLRGVDGCIAVSESLAARVREVAGTDLHVDVIPNGVAPADYHLLDRDRARSMLGWDGCARYLLAVGHLQRVKGFDRLVGAMPAVRAALGDVRLVLAGSGRGERSFRNRLRRMIERCNAQAGANRAAPCVQFVGPVRSDRLNLMYNAADLLVNASRSEGWNNAIAESLAAGTPVVATDVGGNREQICSTELGTIVPAASDHGRRTPGFDGEAFAEAIVTALSREWNRPLISAHGSARTWNRVANEVHAVFARVLAARGRAVRLPCALDPALSTTLATPVGRILEVPR